MNMRSYLYNIIVNTSFRILEKILKIIYIGSQLYNMILNRVSLNNWEFIQGQVFFFWNYMELMSKLQLSHEALA